jgi:hypothetical protein
MCKILFCDPKFLSHIWLADLPKIMNSRMKFSANSYIGSHLSFIERATFVAEPKFAYKIAQDFGFWKLWRFAFASEDSIAIPAMGAIHNVLKVEKFGLWNTKMLDYINRNQIVSKMMSKFGRSSYSRKKVVVEVVYGLLELDSHAAWQSLMEGNYIRKLAEFGTGSNDRGNMRLMFSTLRLMWRIAQRCGEIEELRVYMVGIEGIGELMERMCEDADEEVRAGAAWFVNEIECGGEITTL